MGILLSKNREEECASEWNLKAINQENCAALADYKPTQAQCAAFAAYAPTKPQCVATGYAYTYNGADDWTTEQCLTKYGSDPALFNATTCAPQISAALAGQAQPVYNASTCASVVQAAIAAQPACPTCPNPVYDATTCAPVVKAALAAQPASSTCPNPVYDATTCAPVIAALPPPSDWTRDQCSTKYFSNTGWKCLSVGDTIETDTPVRRFGGAIQCLTRNGVDCEWLPSKECSAIATNPGTLIPSGYKPPLGLTGETWVYRAGRKL
jgi:hypothetical protein